MRLELIKPPAERETLRKTNYYEVEVSLVPGGVYEKWSRNEHYISSLRKTLSKHFDCMRLK